MVKNKGYLVISNVPTGINRLNSPDLSLCLAITPDYNK